MTERRWNGPTPFDAVIEKGKPSWENYGAIGKDLDKFIGVREGYHDAMNSDIVRGLVEAVKYALPSLRRAQGGVQREDVARITVAGDRMTTALADYNAGLEVGDEHTREVRT